ncbi:glycosyltransferase family 4 protein [Exiguobacterium aurantiacum]|uniref:glycosyltransferase family 4 protein n=1 Tax=Exiguobacterium aurantiacum TaxID=33987 RepID=UPI000877678B|nr:glycosyltransferase [Exiguobacterium aurantiacum]
MRKKILVLAGHYLPSINAGGPVQSIKNLVDHLNHEYEFYIIALDRDFNSDTPYSGIKTDKWTTIDNTKVMYIRESYKNIIEIKSIINKLQPDVLYLNSYFSFKFSILPLLLKKIRYISTPKIIVAPRGNFSEGALNLKRNKKSIFILLSKSLSLHKNVIWHSTSVVETRDIDKIITYSNKKVFLSPNLTKNYQGIKYKKNSVKEIGKLKIISISRIHPKKNLLYLLKVLPDIKGEITLNIFGPIEDEKYWNSCEKIINEFPSNIKVKYCGIIENEKVVTEFQNHDIFIFPTLGENFGHIISESLVGGCPVILSDQTPWNMLEQENAGFNIPLAQKERYESCIQLFVDMDLEEYKKKSHSAFDLGIRNSTNSSVVNAAINLFK